MDKRMTKKKFLQIIPAEMMKMYEMTIDEDGNLTIRKNGYINIELKGFITFDDEGITWKIKTTAGIFAFWKETALTHVIIRRRRVL